MIDQKAFPNYFGGKDGNGTYQNIINRIPPHKFFVSLFLGNCAVTRRIAPAKQMLLNDIDKHVVDAWRKLQLPGDVYHLMEMSALDYLKKFKDVDCPGTFIFLDPPYLPETRKSATVYNYEMTVKDHRDLLLQIVSMTAANVMICSYPNPVYDEILKGWNTHDYLSTTRKGQALERLYYNYDLTGQLHDYRFLGDDFREREANNRIVRNMLKKIDRLAPDLRNAVLQKIIQKYKT